MILRSYPPHPPRPSCLGYQADNPFSTVEDGAYSILLQVGFSKLPRSLGALVSPYLTFSPLPRPSRWAGWSPFLWHFPSSTFLKVLDSILWSTLSYGARTFLLLLYFLKKVQDEAIIWPTSELDYLP